MQIFIQENQNMLLRCIIAATEVFAVLICLVLLYGNRHETHRKTRYGYIYSWMVLSNIIALIGDATAWALEGMPEYTVLLFAGNVISIVVALVMIAQFALYITEYLRERIPVNDRLLRAGLVFCSVVIAGTLIACFCGIMFTLEDGVFTPMPFYNVYSAASLMGTLFCLLTVVYYRKALGNHDSIAAYVYIAMPVLSALINLVFPGLSLTYQAVTVSLLVLYVMIQSEQGNKLLEEKLVSAYYAEHDELTGLSSRRAYMKKLAELRESGGTLGVIFCDLNGLKYTNDHFGHEKGDEMIRTFAELLKDHFRHEGIYRISGDEFIIIAERINRFSFKERADRLERSLCENGQQLACIGADYGAAEDMVRLVQNAETDMYRKKEIFHRNHPELQRNRQETDTAGIFTGSSKCFDDL